jgi:hypothetical protein
MTRDTFTVQYWTDGHSGAGWYYFETEYPEEGSAGPYESQAQATIAARLCDSQKPLTSDNQVFAENKWMSDGHG